MNKEENNDEELYTLPLKLTKKDYYIVCRALSQIRMADIIEAHEDATAEGLRYEFSKSYFDNTYDRVSFETISSEMVHKYFKGRVENFDKIVEDSQGDLSHETLSIDFFLK